MGQENIDLPNKNFWRDKMSCVAKKKKKKVNPNGSLTW